LSPSLRSAGQNAISGRAETLMMQESSNKIIFKHFITKSKYLLVCLSFNVRVTLFQNAPLVTSQVAPNISREQLLVLAL